MILGHMLAHVGTSERESVFLAEFVRVCERLLKRSRRALAYNANKVRSLSGTASIATTMTATPAPHDDPASTKSKSAALIAAQDRESGQGDAIDMVDEFLSKPEYRGKNYIGNLLTLLGWGYTVKTDWKALFVPLVQEAQRRQLQHLYHGHPPQQIEELLQSLLYDAYSDISDSDVDSSGPKNEDGKEDAPAASASTLNTEPSGLTKGWWPFKAFTSSGASAEATASTAEHKVNLKENARKKKQESEIDDRFAEWVTCLFLYCAHSK